METGITEKKSIKLLFKFTKRKVLITSLITFILLMLALTAQLSFMTLKYDNVYRGIHINNINVGGLSTREITALFEKNYKNKVKETSIVLKTVKYQETINFSDINVKYDIPAVVNQAFRIGRSGNIFKRYYDVFLSLQNKIYLDIPYSYNANKLNKILNNLHTITLTNVKNSDLYIQNSKVSIKSGHHGESIEKNKVLSDLMVNIKYCKGGILSIPIIKTPPSKINVDDFYNQIERPVVDASVKIVDNKTIFISEVTGRSINKSDLIAIANELEKTENTEKFIPVTYTLPKITLKEIYSKLFKDELKTYSSTFKTKTQNEKNRSINIRLEVAKIDGTVLAPGQVFSYNNIVGIKTPEQGYKEAFTYVGGKQVAGLGGGICQVSSTLYNAVLYADLEVVKRRNHMFEVFYVPFGQDATVYYGSTDFQFRNSTNWPLQIKCSVTDDNQVIFSLIGTNENRGKSVKIQSYLIGKPVPFPKRYIDDPTVENEDIVQIGHNGGTYVTYKTLLQNGKIISTKKITTSTYRPLEQVVKRNPQKLVTPAPTIPAPPIDDITTINPDVIP